MNPKALLRKFAALGGLSVLLMSAQVVVNLFELYRALGFDGCSSHSVRRTAIMRWARKVSSVGGSMRDVQKLAGHSSLQMTQR